MSVRARGGEGIGRGNEPLKLASLLVRLVGDGGLEDGSDSHDGLGSEDELLIGGVLVLEEDGVEDLVQNLDHFKLGPSPRRQEKLR